MTLDELSRHTGAVWHATPAATRGIALMVLSTMAFSTMHVLIRYIADEVHPVQTAFLRNFFGFIVFLPVIFRSGFGFLKTRRLPLHCLRAVINVVAMFAFFTALTISPVARVTALGFSAPIFAAVLSVLILGERFRWRRWAAIIAGFIGTMVILRPGVIPADLGSFLVLSSAALWGVTLIVIKKLSDTESSLTITGYMTILLSALSFVPALFVWTNPPLETWGWLVAIGVIGTLAQVAVAQALKEAEMTLVMPFDFMKLIWVAALGFWLFAEIPDALTWVGAAIVFSSGFYIAYRERKVTG